MAEAGSRMPLEPFSLSTSLLSRTEEEYIFADVESTVGTFGSGHRVCEEYLAAAEAAVGTVGIRCCGRRPSEECVLADAESALGEGTSLLPLVFPIWAWDDGADPVETLQRRVFTGGLPRMGSSPMPPSMAGSMDSVELELARLLGASPVVFSRHGEATEPEVHSILSEALLSGGGPAAGGPLHGHRPPAFSPILWSPIEDSPGLCSGPATSPALRHSVVTRRSPWPQTRAAAAGSTGSTAAGAAAMAGVPPRASSRNSNLSELYASTVISSSASALGGDAAEAAAAAATAPPINEGWSGGGSEAASGGGAGGSASSTPSSPGLPGRAERRSQHDTQGLSESGNTGSLFLLGDSSVVEANFDDSLHLDFGQLLSLGRSPAPLQLSGEEARSLPRVRFEALERQHCSICLEHFRHGMLLTGLSCAHVFHVDCLAQWVQRSAQCPNCRARVEPCGPGTGTGANSAAHRQPENIHRAQTSPLPLMRSH